VKNGAPIVRAFLLLSLTLLSSPAWAAEDHPALELIPTQGIAELSSRAGGGSFFETLKNATSWKFSGYEKSMFFLTKTSGQNPDSVRGLGPKDKANKVTEVFTERFRLNLKVDCTEYFSGYVSYDNQFRAGPYLNTGDFQLVNQSQRDRQAVNTSWLLAHGSSVRYEQSLYRAYVDFKDADLFKVRIGRQQIPWGVGHFFTPTDIFNPYRPTQIETEERQGVDGIFAETAVLDKLAKLEFVFTPHHENHPNRLAFKLKRTILGYDSSLLGGQRDRDSFIGFDLSGNLGNAALRGEGIFFNAAEGPSYSQVTVNMDYNFPSNIYGLLEYHFNGEGAYHRAQYDLASYFFGNATSLAKHYLGATLVKDLTPLWRVETPVIMNLTDTSLVFMPEIKYLISENWNWKCKANIFAGAKADEYGAPKNLYFTELQYFF
jgi:hypothetical protein